MKMRALVLSLLLAGARVPGPAAGQEALPDAEQVGFLLFEGELLMEEGKVPEAVAKFSQVVTLAPENLQGHLLYAQALTRGLLAEIFDEPRKAAETARTHYQWVLDHDPENREAKAGVGLLEETFLAELPSPMKTEAGKEAWKAGQEALREENLEAAARAFEQAAGLEPGIPAAHAALGEALRRDGRHDRALEAYAAALELDPAFLPALVGTGEAQEARGEEDAALDSYRRAMETNPDSRKAAGGVIRILEASRQERELTPAESSLLGRSYLALDRYDPAVEALEQALSEEPDFATRKAMGIAEFFREKDERALRFLGEAHDEEPGDLEILYYMGASHLRLGNNEVGRGFLERLLEADPYNPNAQRLLGISLVDEPGRTEDAARYLLGAHAAGADIQNLSCILGTLYMRLQRTYDATAAFEDCIVEDPDFSGAYLGLGIIADDQGQTRDAIRYLDRYLTMEEDPDRSAIFRLGVAYLRSGQDELGFTTLRRVVQVGRVGAEGDTVELTDTELLEATSFFLATVRRYSDAIFIGEMLLTRDPENSIYNNNLAMSYADANTKIGRAHSLAVRANRLSPDNPGHMDTLGWVLLRMDRYDEAEELLLKSVELARAEDPDQNLSEIYYHLGALYLETQDTEQAREYLELASEDPPTFHLRNEIRRLLDRLDSEAENRR